MNTIGFLPATVQFHVKSKDTSHCITTLYVSLEVEWMIYRGRFGTARDNEERMFSGI